MYGMGSELSDLSILLSQYSAIFLCCLMGKLAIKDKNIQRLGE